MKIQYCKLQLEIVNLVTTDNLISSSFIGDKKNIPIINSIYTKDIINVTILSQEAVF